MIIKPNAIAGLSKGPDLTTIGSGSPTYKLGSISSAVGLETPVGWAISVSNYVVTPESMLIKLYPLSFAISSAMSLAALPFSISNSLTPAFVKQVINSPPHISLAAIYDDAKMKQLITLSYENCVFLSVDNMKRKINTNAPTASETKAPNVMNV